MYSKLSKMISSCKSIKTMVGLNQQVHLGLKAKTLTFEETQSLLSLWYARMKEIGA